MYFFNYYHHSDPINTKSKHQFQQYLLISFIFVEFFSQTCWYRHVSHTGTDPTLINRTILAWQIYLIKKIEFVGSKRTCDDVVDFFTGNEKKRIEIICCHSNCLIHESRIWNVQTTDAVRKTFKNGFRWHYEWHKVSNKRTPM